MCWQSWPYGFERFLTCWLMSKNIWIKDVWRLWPLALQDTVSVNRNVISKVTRFVFPRFLLQWILVTDPSLQVVAPLCTAARSPAQISDRDVLNPVCPKERVRFYTACYVPSKFKQRAVTINRYFCETFSCQCHLGILSLHWN